VTIKEILVRVKESCRHCKECDPCCTGNLLKKFIENDKVLLASDKYFKKIYA
jgi:hypothetical protein